MTAISSIISSSVLIQDKSIRRAGFGTLGIFAFHTLGPAVITIDASASGLSALTTAGLTTGHEAYIKAAAAISQEVKPKKIKIYNRAAANAQTVTLTVTTAVEDYVYNLTVYAGGTATDITYTVLAAATTTTVATAIAALIDAVTGIAATSSVAVITCTQQTAGAARFMIDAYQGDLTYKDTSADAGIATDLATGQAADPAFYGVAIDAYSEAELNAAGAWAQANGKLMLALSCDSDIVTSSTSDVASDYKTAGYTRCGVMFSRYQSGQNAVGLTSRQFALEPGSSDWNNKQIVGKSDSLTATQEGYLETKRASVFTRMETSQGEDAGVALTYNVMAASGRLFDTTRDVDWFEANLQSDELAMLANNEKLTYDAQGKALVEASARRRGSIAEGKGVFVTGSFDVEIPKDGEDDPADKADGLLRWSWTAQKLIGMRKMAISGEVTL